MARASVATFTPLDEVARIAGINPAHFSGAYAGNIAWQPCGVCQDFWGQYAWQSEAGFARENLARTIAEAEIQLGELLGHPLAPTLRRQVFDYAPFGSAVNLANLAPHLFGRTNNFGLAFSPETCGLPSYYLGPHLSKYKARRWAQVTTASEQDFTLAYLDNDGDGFTEIAQIVFSLDTEVKPCFLGLFTYGYFGQATWRIRPVKSVSVQANEDDGNYTYTILVDSWQMIRPELWEDPPRASSGDGSVVGNLTQCSLRAIDMTQDGVFVDKVMVGLQIENPAFPLVTFRFPQAGGCGNSACLACTARTVTGCYAELTKANDFVVPIPATYDEEKGWCVTSAYSCCGITPGTVEIAYFDGGENDYALDGNCGTAPNQALRQIIMLLAISRAQLGQCDCDCNHGQAWKKLGEDLTETKGAGRYLSFDVINNPFGLTRGEIMAWQRYRAYSINNPIMTYGAH